MFYGSPCAIKDSRLTAVIPCICRAFSVRAAVFEMVNLDIRQRSARHYSDHHYRQLHNRQLLNTSWCTPLPSKASLKSNT